MKNKPVAWTTDKLDTNEWEEGDYQITVTKEKWSEKQIPLYTHPMRELTDEEIESAWFKVFKPEPGIGKNITNGVYEFARLIRESD